MVYTSLATQLTTAGMSGWQWVANYHPHDWRMVGCNQQSVSRPVVLLCNPHFTSLPCRAGTHIESIPWHLFRHSLTLQTCMQRSIANIQGISPCIQGPTQESWSMESPLQLTFPINAIQSVQYKMYLLKYIWMYAVFTEPKVNTPTFMHPMTTAEQAPYSGQLMPLLYM